MNFKEIKEFKFLIVVSILLSTPMLATLIDHWLSKLIGLFWTFLVILISVDNNIENRKLKEKINSGVDK